MHNGEVLVKKGTSTDVLNDGVAGYYVDPVKATLPTTGKAGNFTLAAHRDGHGAKFHNIDKLAKGDPIVFETRDDWYVYKVYDILPRDHEVQRGRPRAGPRGVGRDQARPLHHPDDLHPGVHLPLPVRGVGGRTGPGPEGRQQAHAAEGAALSR